jgi:predicted MPP superfamily phosphohydrolase
MAPVILLICLTFELFAQRKEPPLFRLYLIGDAGKAEGHDSYKAFLQRQFQNDTLPSAIVFLGDNIYPKGMPDEGTRSRKKSEEIMRAQLELAKGFNGKVFFVPGNHDWKAGGVQRSARSATLLVWNMLTRSVAVGV